MLNRQIKPPANTTKKTILRKDISTATTKKETYHSKACSSPTPTKITKQNKLIVIPPKTPVKLQKNIQTSSDSRMQTSSPTLKESKEKKDSPRFVRGVSMISKPRLKIPASLPNVLKKNISDSFESIKEEKKWSRA